MRERKAPAVKRTWLHAVEDGVDQVVSLFAPRFAAERMAMRRKWRQTEARLATFEGAASDYIRGSSWLGSKLSADSALEGDLATLRTRSRELYRNDSIGGAVDGRTNLVISYGFTPQARIKERAGLATAEQAKQWNQELEDIFVQTACKICKTGKRSLWQLSRLAERHHGFDGESVTIMSDRSDSSRPIPLTLEVVDPERMETPPGKIGDAKVRLGVEYDDAGKIVAYWIRNTHPGDTLKVDQTYTRYPAERVLHVFEPMFAGQSRGLPWLVRTMNRVKDAKDIDEAAIAAAQVEACYAAFISSPNGASRAADAALAGNTGSDRVEDIIPGTIRYLDRDETVTFGTPTAKGSFAPFQEWNYRRAAAGMNYPYEMLVKNWGGLSFAAGRLSLAEARLMVQSQQQLLNEAWLQAIWERMVFEAVVFAAVSIPLRLYQSAQWWFHQHSWTPPAWPFALTPGEEIDANIKAVDANLKPKAKVVAEFGGDWEDVAAQRRDERALEREYEIEPTGGKSAAPSGGEENPSPQAKQQKKEQEPDEEPAD